MGQIRWPKTCRVLAGAGHQKAREKLAVLSWIQLRINGCCRRGQKELVLTAVYAYLSGFTRSNARCYSDHGKLKPVSF